MDIDMSFPILILGTGGVAKEIYSWLNDLEMSVAAFYDPAGTAPEVIYSLPVVKSFKGWRKSFFILGVEDPAQKVKLAGQATDAGLRILDAVVHPTCLAGILVTLSPGCILGPFSRLASGTSVGDLAYVGSGVQIGPETAVGPFSHIGQGCCLGNGSFIGREVILGDGSIVKDEKVIGDHVRIAPGSVVTKDILSGLSVSGNPARPMTMGVAADLK